MYLKAGISLETSYKDILGEILEHGVERKTRGLTSLELSPFAWTTSNPLRNVLTNKTRKINNAYAIVEFLWIMSGRADLEMLTPYNSMMTQFSTNRISLTGAYGPKITQQLKYVVDKLSEDENSRQAVISIWERRPSSDLDVPCTLSLQFLKSIIGLDLIVTMRSNDVWLGFPYDVFTFTMIQSYVAHKLKLAIGRYTHQAASMHLYTTNLEKARSLIASDTTYASEIQETVPISTDDLELTAGLEQKLRRAYLSQDKDKLTGISREATLLSQPWQGWVEVLKTHLEKKLK